MEDAHGTAVDGWMHGCVGRQKDGWTGGRTDGWTDGWNTGRINSAKQMREVAASFCSGCHAKYDRLGGLEATEVYLL